MPEIDDIHNDVQLRFVKVEEGIADCQHCRKLHAKFVAQLWSCSSTVMILSQVMLCAQCRSDWIKALRKDDREHDHKDHVDALALAMRSKKSAVAATSPAETWARNYFGEDVWIASIKGDQQHYLNAFEYGVDHGRKTDQAGASIGDVLLEIFNILRDERDQALQDAAQARHQAGKG